MKLDEMALLVRVADTRSMTLAARQLRLTPAAVSATVKRVESALGIRLFERTTRSIHPTDDGLVVLEGCQDVVARWQRTLEAVHGADTRLVGTVHLSAPADTTYQILQPVIAGLSEKHPGLQLVVQSGDALQQLHRDAVDIAIRYGPLQDSTLTARKLVDCPVVLVASPAYLEQRGTPARPADLADHRCLTLRLAGAAVTTWSFRQGNVTLDAQLRSPLCGDGFLVRRWALAGEGIARKSLIDVIDDLDAGRLVEVLADYPRPRSPIHAVFPSSRYLPTRVRAVDAAIAAEIDARGRRCEARGARAVNSTPSPLG